MGQGPRDKQFMKWKCFLFQSWQTLLFTFLRVQHTAPWGNVDISTVISCWVNKTLSLSTSVLSQPYFQVVIVRNSIKVHYIFTLHCQSLYFPLISLPVILHSPLFSSQIILRGSLKYRLPPLFAFLCLCIFIPNFNLKQKNNKEYSNIDLTWITLMAIQKKAPMAKQRGFRGLI